MWGAGPHSCFNVSKQKACLPFFRFHCVLAPQDRRGVGFFTAFVLELAERPYGKPECAGGGSWEASGVSVFPSLLFTFCLFAEWGIWTPLSPSIFPHFSSFVFYFFFLSYSEKFRRSCENTRTFGFGLSPTWAGFPTNVVKTNRWVRNGRLGCDQSGSMDLDHTFKFMNVYTLAGGSEFKGLSTTSDWVDWTLYIDHRCKCEWLFACVCGPLIEEIVQLILQPSKMNTFCNWMSF